MRKQDGYMTVELIVTLVVGAILILSLNTIVVTHAYLTQRSRSLVASNAYAEHKIEALRSAGYLQVPIGTTSLTNELPVDLQRPRSGSLVVSQFSTAVKEIRLTIDYNEQGKTRSHSYTTYIGELGVGQY